ncbi:hypothetical protein GCM10023200_01610 [Actinomycetospora chlora]|uniref:HNH nuclease domain-containing protein n=1 Tax=Actinomycetospora chlora TaxID=663608 RepID=A0ABP9A409_9PSEU
MFDTLASTGFQPLPAGIDVMPAGAELAAALAAVDRTRLAPHDTVRLVDAEARQLSHQQARFHAAAREAALADPEAPGGRAEREAADGGDELRARLSLSRTATAAVLTLADAAVRHPELGARWAAGRLDQKRIEHIVRETGDLSGEHAGKVIHEVLPVAAGMTYRALIERLRELAMAIDPDWARRREENARRQRRVRATVTAAGTVNVCGLDLPLSPGTRMTRQINRLAARVKALGHPGRIDTIRGDVLTTRFDPALSGATDDEIVAAVLALADEDDPADHLSHDPADAPPDPAAPDRDEPDRDEPDRDELDADEPDANGVEAGAEEPAADRRRGPRQSRFEIRVRLSTLLGHDEKPARLPGWGTVHAGQARELVAEHADAEWRVAITDHTGALVATLVTRRRPTRCTTTPQDPDPPGMPRAVVELHVSEAELDRLGPDHELAWVRVLGDLREQWARRRAAEALRPEDGRFPSSALRRWTEMRDGTCVFPSCHCPAVDAEIDHTLPHGAGGPTADGNLGPLCLHDHLLKDRPGWCLRQPRPGHFSWTSPTGHTYHRAPQVLFDALPDPDPPDHPSDDTPYGYATNDPIWDGDPYPRGPAPRARPDPPRRRPGHHDDPPPF